MPNEKLTIEKYEIQNNSSEHEDEQTIPEYDPTWYDITNSDENESDFGNENNEYKEPTCNDSDPDIVVGYASFNDHNEAHPIDLPIKAHPFSGILWE